MSKYEIQFWQATPYSGHPRWKPVFDGRIQEAASEADACLKWFEAQVVSDLRLTIRAIRVEVPPCAFKYVPPEAGAIVVAVEQPS